MGTSRKSVALVAVMVVAGAAVLVSAGTAAAAADRHVLLLSVDGMHQADLTWYVAHNPDSALAGLAATAASSRPRALRSPPTHFRVCWAS